MFTFWVGRFLIKPEVVTKFYVQLLYEKSQFVENYNFGRKYKFWSKKIIETDNLTELF